MKLLRKYAVVLALVSVFSIVFSLVTTAEAVDFDASTSLSIHMSRLHILKGQAVRITGSLTSSQHSCENNERINLYANGDKVAHTRTGGGGGYKFVQMPRRDTRYRTKYPGKTTGVHPDQHICEPSKSGFRTVRVT